MKSSAGIAELKSGVAMTLGREPCDLALVHASVVDVFGRTVLPDRTVLVGGGRILAVVPSEACPAPRAGEIADCSGRPLVPGLMDAHLHIESTLMTPERFAGAVLPWGTTCVVADPHEIANVAGVRGVEYMLAASRDLPVRILIALPSCVPCTPFEDAGAVLDAAALMPLFADENVCSLGEVMNYPGLLAGDEDLLAKIEAAVRSGRRVDGHCPGLTGMELQAYAGCGIMNDHEEADAARLKERVASGMYVFVREGSAARGLERMLPAVTPENAHRFCFCTDDLHAGDILEHGHINAILAKAVRLGLPAPTAVAMATLNPAQCFGLARVGAVAPGYRADLVLMEDLADFRPRVVWSGGELAAKNGKALPFRQAFPVPEDILHSVRLAGASVEDLRLELPSGKARVIGILPHDLCTVEKIMPVAVDKDGCFDMSKSPGLCKVAVFERHKALGKVGVGILDGYARPGTFLGGALATSVSHDSHNIVAAGSSDEDMITAVRAVADMDGGIALVRDGVVAASLRLPVGGLMTLEDAAEVARQMTVINDVARSYSVSDDVDPVVTLSFMALCVIPALKLNTRGLFDVNRFCFVPVDAGVEA